MLQNNNRGVIFRLAKISLKAGKRRNVPILLIIVIATALMASLLLYLFGMRTASICQMEGAYQASVSDVNDEELEKLRESTEIDGIGFLWRLGTVQQQEYTLSISGMDSGMLEIGKMDFEGNAPQMVNDVILDKRFAAKYLGNAGIGDAVVLSLDGVESEFHVTGFTSYKESEKDLIDGQVIFNMVVSPAYIDAHNKNSDEERSVYLRFRDGFSVSENELKETIHRVAARCGIQPNRVFFSQMYFYANAPLGAANILTFSGIAFVVAITSALVIYNIFYIYVAGNIRNYGRLRTLGATQKQIRQLVKIESASLSVLGIVVGLMLSTVIVFIAIPNGFSFAIWLGVALFTAIFIGLVVHVSVSSPAKLAARVSPVEATRYLPAKSKDSKNETSKLHRVLSPVRLALIQATRNKKKTVLTFLSLSLSGILFAAAASFFSSISVEKMVRGAYHPQGEIFVSINQSGNIDTPKGSYLSFIQRDNPMPQLKAEILQVPGVNRIYSQAMAVTKAEASGVELKKTNVSGFRAEDVVRINEHLIHGHCDYEQYKNENSIVISIASTITEISGWKPNLGEKVTIEFETSNGFATHEFTIRGISDERIQEGDFLLPESTLTEITGLDNTYQYTISVDKSVNPDVVMNVRELVVSSPNFYIETMEDIIASQQQTMQLFMVLSYVLIGILAVFGIINLASTIITNVLTRKQELSMMQAVGMTKKQLRRMLNTEGFTYSGSAIGITLTIGTLVGIILCRGINYTTTSPYLDYKFPVLPILLFSFVLLCVQLFVTGFSLRTYNKQALVERIMELGS